MELRFSRKLVNNLILPPPSSRALSSLNFEAMGWTNPFEEMLGFTKAARIHPVQSSQKRVWREKKATIDEV